MYFRWANAFVDPHGRAVFSARKEVISLISGILFMTGTLDSDCKVFTEDLEYLTGGRIHHKASIPYYGLFVLFVFSLFISGIIRQPFAFNEYSSMIFLPLMVLSVIECVKIIKAR